MKIFIVLIFCFTFSMVFSQTDRNGNPVFNSEVISEEEYGMDDVTAMYYLIDNNIDNRKSSVYVTDDPSLKEYIKFATTLPSYGFMISTDRVIKYMAMVGPSKDGEVTIVVMNTKGQAVKETTVNLKGTITEGRAKELIEIEADKSAKITEKDGVKKLSFDKADYRIIPFSSIKKEVYKLLDEITGKTEKKETGSIIDFIKKESIGGGLDYEKSLDKSILYEFEDKMLYSQPEASVYLWAKGVKKLGVESASEALKLYEEIYKKTLEGGMKKAFEAGYNSK